MLKGEALTKADISPKDEFDTIAEAALIGEERSIKKEGKAKSAAPYLSNKAFCGKASLWQPLKITPLPR